MVLLSPRSIAAILLVALVAPSSAAKTYDDVPLVVAAHVNQHGDTAQLVARDGYLYCQWIASVDPYAPGFIPSDYSAGCSLRTPSGTVECTGARTFGSTIGGGSAVGACKLVRLDPFAIQDASWTVAVYAHEFTTRRPEAQTPLREAPLTWQAFGGCAGSVHVLAVFLSGSGTERGALDLPCNEDTLLAPLLLIAEPDLQVWERHATLLSASDVPIGILP